MILMSKTLFWICLPLNLIDWFCSPEIMISLWPFPLLKFLCIFVACEPWNLRIVGRNYGTRFEELQSTFSPAFKR